jgi:transposase
MICLGELTFAHPARHLAHEEMLQRIERVEALCDRPKRAIAELEPRWSLAPVVLAIQALRRVSLVVAAVIVAEVASFGRFDKPRQLMAYLQWQDRQCAGAICLVDAAWTYRFPARVATG